MLFLSSIHVVGTSDCGVEDILVFLSGAEHVPPLGFSPNPKLSFCMVKRPSSALQAPVTSIYDYLLAMVMTTRHFERQ